MVDLIPSNITHKLIGILIDKPKNIPRYLKDLDKKLHWKEKKTNFKKWDEENKSILKLLKIKEEENGS